MIKVLYERKKKIDFIDNSCCACLLYFTHGYCLLYLSRYFFTFIEYDNRGHNYLYYTDEARSYGKKLSEDFTSFKKSLQVEITPEIRAEYFKKHLDKKHFFEVDKRPLDKIVFFYDNNR